MAYTSETFPDELAEIDVTALSLGVGSELGVPVVLAKVNDAAQAQVIFEP